MINTEILQNMVSSYQKSRIILTAFELEIFTLLSEKKLNLNEISTNLNTDLRATEILLNSLCAIELLEKEDDKYFNSTVAEKVLVKGKHTFWANLHHTNSLWNTWSNLSEVVRNGSPEIQPFIENQKESWVEDFIISMHTRARIQAPKTANILDLSNVKSVLDVGGGSGAFSMAFIDKKADIKATVFDLPNVLPTSKKYIEKEGYTNKIRAVEGNYLTDNFPEKYDLILLSAIIHINSLEENKELIKKCANSLNVGGQVIISDFIQNEEKTGPQRATLFAVNMLVGTQSGNTYTGQEVKEMFTYANLTFKQRIDTDFKGTILIATK